MSVSWELKATDVAGLILTAVLVAVTIYYAYATAQYVAVSRDMARQMQQANAVNLRPYVLIEELSPEQLTAMERGDARNVSASPARTRAYPIGHGTDAEYVFYNVHNLGSVPAHDVKHIPEVQVVDENTGQATSVPIVEPALDTTEALLPQQVITRVIKVPSGTFFQDSPAGKVISVSLRVNFSGVRGVDPNRYFYSVRLRSRPVRSVEDMNRPGFGGITVEHSDEGVEAAQHASP